MKDKTLLTLSLAGNILLAGIVSMNISHRHTGDTSDGAANEATIKSSAPVNSSAVEYPAIPDAEFDASQSSNYPAFVARLRNAGLPEQTISNVIIQDLGNVYAVKYLELQARVNEIGSAAVEAESNKLTREESAMIEMLTGHAATSNPNTIATVATPAKTTLAPAMTMPLAFAAGNNDTLNLTPQQQALVEGIRRNFVADLGGPNADPSTADYAQRWTQAQPLADQLLKARFGYQAFVEFQRQSERSALNAR